MAVFAGPVKPKVGNGLNVPSVSFRQDCRTFVDDPGYYAYLHVCA